MNVPGRKHACDWLRGLEGKQSKKRELGGQRRRGRGRGVNGTEVDILSLCTWLKLANQLFPQKHWGGGGVVSEAMFYLQRL